MKLTPKGLYQLLDIIVKNYQDPSAPNYFKGEKLVELFNAVGFEDDYEFGNSENAFRLDDKYLPLSRKDYVKHRLKILNERGDIERIVEPLFSIADDKQLMQAELDSVFTMPTATKNVKVEHSSNEDLFATPKITEGIAHQRVFISYSWDDEEHKAWVWKLSEDLRKQGIESKIDQYYRLGNDLIDFMEKGIGRADKVLIIGTPVYKEKSEQEGGGVRYEQRIIKANIFHGIVGDKYIPVLRRGTYETSFPEVISTKDGCDMVDDARYDEELNKLVHEIWGIPLNEEPPLGDIPDFVKKKHGVISTDFKAQRDNETVELLFNNFSCNIMDDYFREAPLRIPMDLVTSSDMWDGIMFSSTFIIYDDELRNRFEAFSKLWLHIMEYGGKYYVSKPDSQYYHFAGLQHDRFVSGEDEQAYQRIKNEVLALQPLYKSFIDYVKQHYPINLSKSSTEFENGLHEYTIPTQSGMNSSIEASTPASVLQIGNNNKNITIGTVNGNVNF